MASNINEGLLSHGVMNIFSYVPKFGTKSETLSSSVSAIHTLFALTCLFL